MSNKLTLIKLIKEKKNVLFGAFSSTLTKIDKCNAWKEIHQTASALNLVGAERDWPYTRDVLWQNIKKAAVVIGNR